MTGGKVIHILLGSSILSEHFIMIKYITVFSIILLSYSISFAQEMKTPSGITAKIEKYNVVLYKNNTKIDTLTTKWNTNESDFSGIITYTRVKYTILWIENNVLLVEKVFNDGKSGRSGHAYYTANLKSQNIKLKNVTDKLWKKLWMDARISKNDTGDLVSELSIPREDTLSRENATKNGYTLSIRASDDQQPIDLYIRAISSLESLGL